MLALGGGLFGAVSARAASAGTTTIDTATPWQSAGSHSFSEHCFGGCSAGYGAPQQNTIGEVFTAPRLGPARTT